MSQKSQVTITVQNLLNFTCKFEKKNSILPFPVHLCIHTLKITAWDAEAFGLAVLSIGSTNYPKIVNCYSKRCTPYLP